MNPRRKTWVIGSGFLGLCIAHELARREIPVGVVSDDWGEGRASYGNAGHIAVEQVETLADPKVVRSLPSKLFSRGGPAAFPIKDIGSWLPFGLRYLKRSTNAQFVQNSAALKSLMSGALSAWQQLVIRLGHPEYLSTNGHAVVFESAESASHGARHWLQANCGDVNTALLSDDELRSIGADVSAKLYGGVQFYGSGQLENPGAVLDTLKTALADVGTECRVGRLDGILPSVNGFTLKLASGDELTADNVVIAAGARSHELLQSFTLRVPLIAENGYHLEGPLHGSWSAKGPLVFEDRNVVVTRFGDRLRATSFVEFANHRSPPDLRKWQRLNHHLNAIGIPMGGPRIPWMGARPTLPDYLPALGAVSRIPGLWTAFGHQHLGVTLAPISASLLVARMRGEPSNINLDAFSVDRFI